VLGVAVGATTTVTVLVFDADAVAVDTAVITGELADDTKMADGVGATSDEDVVDVTPLAVDAEVKKAVETAWITGSAVLIPFMP
jgi:hypothetical protein